jgi:Ca2+-transporting ATPase
VLGEPALTVGDQANMAFAGTTVARGRGRGVVVRTGGSTELGRIASAMREVGRPATPMEEAFARFGRLVGAVIVALAVVVLGLGLARGMAPADIFLTAVAMAVSAIPEGLPVVLTITLAVGVRRMARRRAIVRALPAVETLGSTTVIGSDKTGTLTKNEMTVRAIWAGGRRFDVTGVGYAADGEIRAEDGAVRATADRALLATLSTAVLASEADPSERGMGKAAADPTELALFAVASKGGVDPVALRRSRAEVDLLPFESDRQYMVSLRESEAGLVEHLKGAPEVVLALCTRQLGRDGEEEPVDREAALGVVAAFAGEGLRVLAMAYRPSTTPAARRIAEPTHGDGYVLAGLVGMEDPVRPEAIQAVADARSAGVRGLMLTGDHGGTARVIGRRLGLGERAVTGSEIAQATDEALDRALGETNVFARVAPEHKLRIVQRLRAAGEVVAVTGDGVNDAPALRAAHLGIAMGASGSDVAREASDMVLADDDFATITAAIEEGRVVFANIRKATFFLLSTAAGEVLAILVALLAGWPVPFTAAQILWINLVTDSLQVMALAFEPGEPGLMRDPPRPRGTGVLTSRLVVRLGGVGLVLTAVTLGTFWWTLRTTGDMTTARTAALTQMVVLQFYHVFNCRSLDRSLFTISPLSNRFLFVSMVAVTLAHLAAVYAAPLQVVLRTTALGGEQGGVILVAGLAVVGGGELD